MRSSQPGQEDLTGEQVRDGLENLDITQARLDAARLRRDDAGRSRSPATDHEGNGPILIQQWDGKEWKIVSDWIEPMRDVVRPMMETSAKKFAEENKITPRQCAKPS